MPTQRRRPDRRELAPGTYSIFGNQCTSVGCSSLMSAGINLQQMYFNHGDPGPDPVNTWLLTPGEFGDILEDPINSSIVTGNQYYQGH